MVVTVTYEGVPIVRGAAGKLLPGGEVFVYCDAPMPVWTPLTIELDGGKPQSAQVIAVEEGPTPPSGSQQPRTVTGQAEAGTATVRQPTALAQPGMLLAIGDVTQVADRPATLAERQTSATLVGALAQTGSSDTPGGTPLANPAVPGAAATSKSPKSKRKRRR